MGDDTPGETHQACRPGVSVGGLMFPGAHSSERRAACNLATRGPCELHGGLGPFRPETRASGNGTACALSERRRSTSIMLDAIFILSTAIFFGVAWAYVLGCDRLLEDRQP